MKATILIALGLMSLMQPISAADPQTNAVPTYYYTQGGRNDPFMNFAGSFLSFGDALDKYDKLPSSSSDSERKEALNFVRMMAAVLSDKQPEFAIFFGKSHLPPAVLAVSKPLFDALKNEKFQKERENFPTDFEHIDIDHLRRLYAVYATLPFPTDKQLSQYMHAWDPPGQLINSW
jgi:hypothetical protein